MRKQSALVGILLSVGSVVATLVVLEIALWIRGNVPDYPTRYEWAITGCEISPGFVCDESLGCHFVPEHFDLDWGRYKIINALGFPDSDEFELVGEQVNAYKILFIGDSVTFGLSTDYGNGVVELTESLMQQDRPTVVWNTSIPGTGQRQQLATLKGVFPLMHPDLVVLGLSVGTDFNDNLYPLDWRVLVGRGGFAGQYALDENLEPVKVSCLEEHGLKAPEEMSFAEYAVRRTNLGSLVWRKLGLSKTYDIVITPDREIDERLWDRQVAATRDLLIEIRDYVAANDSYLLVLIIPTVWEIEDGGGPRYEEAVRLMEELGIDYVSPFEVLRVDDYYYEPAPDGGRKQTHWIDSGHEKAARVLVDHILTLPEE
jgi:hypothetical protein